MAVNLRHIPFVSQAVPPVWVLTERQRTKWATPEKLAANLELQSLKHELSSDDIADAVMFLTSDSARSITGQQLIFDAGTACG
jgi:galactose dehydrogenase